MGVSGYSHWGRMRAIHYSLSMAQCMISHMEFSMTAYVQMKNLIGMELNR